jgi:nitrite reductase/ring-hydroxylating ferredoxin subunit
MNFSKHLLLSTLVVAALAISACKKTNTCNGVPNVAVSFTIDLNQPQYNPLVITGGAELVSGGNAGIVIYRYQQDQFEAYDCLCPYDGANNSSAVVSIGTNKLTGSCAVCKSVFSFADGSVISGPSTCPLKAYKATYDGSRYVTVTN